MRVGVCERARVGMGLTLCAVSMRVLAVCLKMGESKRALERERLQGDVGPGVGNPRPRAGTELMGCPPFQQVIEGDGRGKQQLLGCPGL